MITPIEIRKKEFEKAFRGYEKEEVDAFLQTLSQEWERIIEENKELLRKTDAQEKEIMRLREVETTLFKTLKAAEDTSSQIIEQANKSAELFLREAQMNAEAILNEARSKARAMIEDAEIEVKHIIDDLLAESKNIEKEYTYIDELKNNLLEDIRTLTKEILDKIDKYAFKTSRTAFDEKIKEIRKLNTPATVKNLEITNSSLLSPVIENPPPQDIHSAKENPEVIKEKSFFDSIE